MENFSNTSERLLRRMRAGESAGFSEFQYRYEKRLLSLARSSLLGQLTACVDPSDISQEAFIEFFRKLERDEICWTEQGDLWRLLAGIAKNKVRRQFEFHNAAKRDHFRTKPLLDGVALKASDPEAGDCLMEVLNSILDQEKPILKSIVALRLAGLDNQQIASRIGRSDRTVRRILESLYLKFIQENDLAILSDNRKNNTHCSPYPETVSLDDFVLLRMIGAGKFGKVYLARKKDTEEIFAIKVLRKQWFNDSDARQRFLLEGANLLLLSHPGIVEIYESKMAVCSLF